ncbi:MAG: RDD family protein, partial [Bacteroidota bacterium]
IYTILSIPILMYDFLWEYFSNGQSVGKKVMAIKVVKLNGTQPSAGAYLLRWLLRIIDFMLGPVIAIFSISVTKNYQRLGDLAADTTVIKLKGRTSIRNTILYKAIPGYEIQFRQVEKLSDKDISIIKEVFDYCRKNRDDKALLKLAEKVRKQLGLDKVDKSPEEFINTILIDYSQFEFKN